MVYVDLRVLYMVYLYSSVDTSVKISHQNFSLFIFTCEHFLSVQYGQIVRSSCVTRPLSRRPVTNDVYDVVTSGFEETIFFHSSLLRGMTANSDLVLRQPHLYLDTSREGKKMFFLLSEVDINLILFG